jgi:DNA-binding NarL/FixJ family response regulator
MTTVLVVDDHALVREGLSRALRRAGFDVVGEAADGEEAVALALEHTPDVVLMDLSLPTMSGIGATKQIRTKLTDTAVIVLSMLSDEAAVSSAFDAGAVGFIGKDSTTQEIVAAVRAVAEHGALPPGSGTSGSGMVMRRAPADTSPALITRREEEVLRLMATGISMEEAASQLFISQKTLKNHLSSIYQKLGSHDRAQAVLKAIRVGLIKVT